MDIRTENLYFGTMIVHPFRPLVNRIVYLPDAYDSYFNPPPEGRLHHLSQFIRPREIPGNHVDVFVRSADHVTNFVYETFPTILLCRPHTVKHLILFVLLQDV